MRFMMIVKSDPRTESGVQPSNDELEEMAKYNEELVKAGVMLAGDGLHPSSEGARVHFDGKKRRVVDGPFTEAKELIAGYWLLQVESKEEALEWAKRVPFSEGHVELRKVFELEDFDAGEGVEHHRRLREQLAKG